MKTKILLIGLTIFLVNVISVNARETIKSCRNNEIINGMNLLVFPKDGGKPYGRNIETLLSLTNRLNLQLEIEEQKGFKDCTDKMRSGEIDILVNVYDKGDRRDYMEYIPYLECQKCPGNKKINFTISKKSKFISRIAEFKTALLSEDDYIAIYKTNYTSADQHDWDVSIDDYFQDIENQLKELKKELKKKKRE